MGVVTRGMGDMGAVARAGAVSLSVARVPGVEVAGELETRALFSTPARVGGRAVAWLRGGRHFEVGVALIRCAYDV